ncbi:MAG: hypothetical protein IKJ39_11920 [Lachnospiraceae bacterium]|nr:hypothetical protein [Lachnospiraceae bacterium]
MIKKQGISLLLSAMLVFSLCSCGQTEVETTGKNIELLEPVNVTTNVELAARRTLYDSEIYAATVYPTITEYSFNKQMEVEGKGAFWGESVSKGETLVYGSTEKIDEQIEQMQEQIDEMDKAMTKTQEKMSENLAEPKEELKRMKSILDNFAKSKPAEMVPASSVSAGDSDELIENPEYLTWQRDSEMWTGKYRILEHNINMQEESFRQQKELYDLDRAYMVEQLEQLKKERKNCVLVAKEAGQVVAKQLPDDYGNLVAQKEQAVIAVGNMNEKVIKSEFINTYKASKAKEMYAVIDGVRYEVEYHAIDNDEYKKISESGVKVYTDFTFLDDCSQVEVGDFVSICVLYEKETDALSVPSEAVHKDGGINFVYVMKDGESIMTTVTTGFSDGVYTVIKSGLNEGDAVLVEDAREVGTKTAKVQYGSFHGTYKENGRTAGSMAYYIKNTIEYGTTYFGEYKVEYFQHVKKGDVIATIRVAPDELTMQRKEQQLQRAQERLADLRAAGEEDNEEAIEAKLKEISEIQELLDEMREDARTTEIRADRSGMVIDIKDFEAETILYNGTQLVQIVDESSVYVSVPDSNSVLGYGTEVEITFDTYFGTNESCTGVVASINNAGLSKELQSDRVMIMVPKEDLPNIAMARVDNRYDPKPFTVVAKTREMDHVLVVPKSAVTEVDGKTYVNVKDEQGNVKMCSFVAGGYDDTNYWIIEGLSEGMVVCLK